MWEIRKLLHLQKHEPSQKKNHIHLNSSLVAHSKAIIKKNNPQSQICFKLQPMAIISNWAFSNWSSCYLKTNNPIIRINGENIPFNFQIWTFFHVLHFHFGNFLLMLDFMFRSSSQLKMPRGTGNHYGKLFFFLFKQNTKKTFLNDFLIIRIQIEI